MYKLNKLTSFIGKICGKTGEATCFQQKWLIEIISNETKDTAAITDVIIITVK